MDIVGKNVFFRKKHQNKLFFMNNIDHSNQINFYKKVEDLLKEARKTVVKTVNRTMVYTYLEIGRLIVDEEQNGQNRADYGKHVLKELSKRLNAEFGKGFSVTNLQQMKNFYIIYGKQQTVSVKSKTAINAKYDFQLSWSHYLFLMLIDNLEERKFYEIESTNNNWSLRELLRQFDTALYERLSLSRDEDAIKELSEKGQIIEKAKDSLKDPYVLEFIGIPKMKSIQKVSWNRRS